MSEEPKKRKRGNPNFARGKKNPYSDKARKGRWENRSQDKLVENSPKLVVDQKQQPSEPPQAA